MLSGYERLALQAARERLIARVKARPVRPPSPYEVLYRLADPEALRWFHHWRDPLSQLYTWQRRACVLRAWCARHLGWRDVVREDLRQARWFRRLAVSDLRSRARRR
jgi:hypothetical protein